MTLYNITKPENLFKVLNNCKGDVEMVMPDGDTCKWDKEGHLVASFLKATDNNRIKRMELKLNNTQDTMHLIDFLVRGDCA